MKAIKITLLVFSVLLVFNVAVASPEERKPDGASEVGGRTFDMLNFQEVNKYAQQLNNELNADLPVLDKNNIMQMATKGIDLNWSLLLQRVMGLLFKELIVNAQLLGKLLILAVMCSLLQNLMSSFEKGTVGTLAYTVCFMLLIVIAVTVFNNAVDIAKNAINTMVSFMQALLPLLLALLAGVGAVTTAAIYQPLMLFVTNGIAVVIKDFIFPLLFLAMIVEIIGQMYEQYKLSNLVGLMKQTGMLGLGLALVLFVGVVSVQGVAGSVSDGVTLRAAKFATGAFIPVVGKMLADSVELVASASLMLKNIVGIFGVVVVGIICVIPVIKLVAMAFIIKTAGALVQPLGDVRMAKCLDGMGNNLLLVFGAMVTVALMFFISIVLILGTGNVAVMLR